MDQKITENSLKTNLFILELDSDDPNSKNQLKTTKHQIILCAALKTFFVNQL